MKYLQRACSNSVVRWGPTQSSVFQNNPDKELIWVAYIRPPGTAHSHRLETFHLALIKNPLNKRENQVHTVYSLEWKWSPITDFQTHSLSKYGANSLYMSTEDAYNAQVINSGPEKVYVLVGGDETEGVVWRRSVTCQCTNISFLNKNNLYLRKELWGTLISIWEEGKFPEADQKWLGWGHRMLIDPLIARLPLPPPPPQWMSKIPFPKVLANYFDFKNRTNFPAFLLWLRQATT